MRVTQLTFPSALPIRLQDVKTHCRIEQEETVFDDDLSDLIRTATEWVEETCHLKLITTSVRADWDCFPDYWIRLPLWPVSSITTVAYTDTGGSSATVTSYQTDLTQAPARICPAINATWPATQADKVAAVRVTFNAGYGADASYVPHKVKHLLKLLVGHWFLHREAVTTGTTKEIELAAESLATLCRVNEFVEFIK